MESPTSIDRTAGQPRKRRRESGTEAFATRKRAAKACHFCRLRKTKCDNRRPVCGFCQTNRAKCVYDGDEEEACSPPATESNQEILQRLDELKSIVASLSSSRQNCQCSPNDHRRSLQESINDGTVLQRCESLLRWPVFQAFLSTQERCVQSFVLESHVLENDSIHTPISANYSSARALLEEEVLPLVNKFFECVSPRNPILDSTTVKRIAARVSENGFGWDNESCLILLICALAHYTTKWSTNQNDHNYFSPSSDATGKQRSDPEAAKAYFIAAKKRIGLLRDAIVDIQCLFLAHIYEKCALRPLEAAYYIQQASIRLQVHMAHKDSSYCETGLTDRLFWSTVRAESELLPELCLQRSGLHLLGPASSFPQPPDCSLQQVRQREGPEPEQRGWYFYLAEISIRRTLPEMVELMYTGGQARWLEDITVFVPRHAECDRQIHELRSHLPGEVQFDDVGFPSNELAFFLKGRFLECHVVILQPFLYYIVHTASSTVNDNALRLAQECIRYCAERIRHTRIMNRHGGTWFGLRGLFASTMMLLGAALEPDHVKMPGDWPELAELAIETLHIWSPGLPDIEAMLSVLRKVYQCTKAARLAMEAST